MPVSLCISCIEKGQLTIAVIYSFRKITHKHNLPVVDDDLEKLDNYRFRV